MRTLIIIFAICSLVLAALARPAAALDSSDLLFHVSFDTGLPAEFSRGTATPAKVPAEESRRLVEGLMGKGWLFGGKASGIEYFTGDKGGDRTCKEMYGSKANLFGDSGTMAFWLKGLPNTHNMAHAYFRMWPLQITRNQYTHHQYNYNAKGGYVYDAAFIQNPWVFFALTWRKDEARAYFNGNLMSIATETGVLAPTPERFEIACEGQSWIDFQKKEFEDDAVMDEFQLFRRPLTGEEIRSLFERGHVTTRQQNGNIPDGLISKPERAYLPTAVSAATVTPGQISVTGDPAGWAKVPTQGCFIERRVGLLDRDPTRVMFACDGKNLHLGFICPVEDSIRKDPTHVWYPTGEFLAGVLERDGDVAADDYIEFRFRSKDGHLYRYLLNARGTISDSRDGDKAWNTAGQFSARSDFTSWTGGGSIPLAELGAASGDILDFNVIRSWRLFSSAQNALCIDERSQPSWGSLVLGGAACASLESAGRPEEGTAVLNGSILGPAGEYTVSVLGKGIGREFRFEEKIRVGAGPAAFTLTRKLEKPGDLALAVEIKDPAGKTILSRTVPCVYVAATAVDLADYPGWGRLEVSVTPMQPAGLRAAVALVRDGKDVASAEIPEFKDPSHTVTLNTSSLPIGQYTVVTRLFKEGRQVGEDRQPFEKKALPAWYHNTVGIIDRPPVPWTDVRAEGNRIRCLLKETSFNNTLFPSAVVSNGQNLLAGPVRLRVKTAAGERVITAASSFRVTDRTRRRAGWTSTTQDGTLSVRVNGWVEFDGFTWMDMTLAGETVEHVTVEIPLDRKTARLKNIEGPGLVTDRAWKTIYPSYWFGNEKAGIEYWFEDQRSWVMNGEQITITASPAEVTIAMPVIQKKTDLKNPRTIGFGWTPTPSKPVRNNWRSTMLYRGVTYTAGDYTFATPNYPKPRATPEQYQQMAAEMVKPGAPIVLWYAFGPFMWVGSPEYAAWWREWRWVPSEMVKPDPNNTVWGPACPKSSSGDLFVSMLDAFIKKYPLRGLYFDCMTAVSCRNEAHDCGYVDEQGVRQPTGTLFATRRYYERIYNLIKGADPKDGWVRFHDWGNWMYEDAFCDENWIGEGLIGPINGTPEKNYYRVVDIPAARFWFTKEQWGHLTSWLTELACSAGDDKEKRAGWYGKMITPPKDGKPGVWTLPRWKDYEHVAGLGIIHDAWAIGGNDLELPWMWLNEIYRMMRWDDAVRFSGYWENGNMLELKGGVAEQIVCSVYWRPGGLPTPEVTERPQAVRVANYLDFSVADTVNQYLRAAGTNPAGWILLAPMNNTDQDVTIALTLNTKRLGFPGAADGKLVDVFRSFGFTWKGPPGWWANAGDPEPPVITVEGKPESFPFTNGTATVTIPKRSFRALLIEPRR